MELSRSEEAVEILRKAAGLLDDDVLPLGIDAVVRAHVRGVALTYLGSALERLEVYEEALRCQEDALKLYDSKKNRWGVAWALAYLGETNAHAGRIEAAIEYLTRASAQRELRNTWREGVTMSILGRVLADSNRSTEALRVYGEALAVHRKPGKQVARRTNSTLAQRPSP